MSAEGGSKNSGIFPFPTAAGRAILTKFSYLYMPSCEQVLADLIHDLAQPLGTIETSAYCLDLQIDPRNARAQQYLEIIRQQVAQAAAMLAAAAAEIGHARPKHFELTA